MTRRSRYVLVIDNISSETTSRDIKKELEYTAGKVRDVVRNPSTRCAIAEFDRAGDCEYAWRKMDGFRMDGRAWKVNYAKPSDFRYFGWKWFEDPSPEPRYRHRSRSASRSPPRSRSRSRSQSRSRSRSRSRSSSPISPKPVMQTPGNQEGKQTGSS